VDCQKLNNKILVGWLSLTTKDVFFFQLKSHFAFVLKPALEIIKVYRVYPDSTDKLSELILRSKISIKLLIHMGSKTLSLRDNQKRKNNYDLNSLDFMGLSFCKLYIAPFYFCTFHQKIPPDSFCCW
jgi:hypothetical protein